MNSCIFGMLAETSIHPGAGQSAGFVDLPVSREVATDYPVIWGSGLKGALLSWAKDNNWKEDECEFLFGKPDNAGALIIPDARLLLLPVRSLTSHFKWVTCPYLIERLDRDLARSSILQLNEQAFDWTPLSPEPGEEPAYLGTGNDDLFLEERRFNHAGGVPEDLDLISKLKNLIYHSTTFDRLHDQLVIVSDISFAWFVRYGLAINARNVLDPETKRSNNLWYEETIPPDSLFYSLIVERTKPALTTLKEYFKSKPYLRVGGNETVGQGWFALKQYSGG